MVSSISESLSHNAYDLNCIQAGNLGGAIKTGQTVTFGAGTANAPVANIWLTLMRAFGLPNTSFGNSTGVIPQLLA